MTTPAENAATVREALGWVETLPEGQFSGEAEAALAALLAQAEAAEILQDKLDVEREVHAEVEAERDAAVRVRDQFVMKADESLARALTAERAAETLRKNIKDEAIQTILAKEYGSEQFARAETAEAAAEQAQEALRQIINYVPVGFISPLDDEDSMNIRAIARAALTGERTEEPEGKYGDWRDDPGNYGE